MHPTSVADIQQAVLQHTCLVPRGGGTKPTLSNPPVDGISLDMRALSGLLAYEPGEYTFTAYAGTPLQVIQTALAEHQQYLPFDPLLVARGATLGGTVAANTAGSGRYRYGGVRDFVLGVQFVNGLGELVNSGGKVVKNSAGFDLPKFMVGSVGRFGVLISLSFKVFPRPPAYVTLRCDYDGLGAALAAVFSLATTSFDLDALDLLPVTGDTGVVLLLRLGGLPEALSERQQRLQAYLHAETTVGAITLLREQADALLWAEATALDWVPPDAGLVKVPLSPRQIPVLENVLPDPHMPRRYTAGGNVAWLSSPRLPNLGARLQALGLSGLVLRGEVEQPFIGLRAGLSLSRRVQKALDPEGRFLSI